MKKYVIGIIILSVITFTGQAVAGTTSNTEKKVDSDRTVSACGEKRAYRLGEPPLRKEDRIKQINSQIAELEKQLKKLEAQK